MWPANRGNEKWNKTKKKKEEKFLSSPSYTRDFGSLVGGFKTIAACKVG